VSIAAGFEKGSFMSAEIKPYRISIGCDVLHDLKSRLRNTRWPEAELVEDWSQGAPLKLIKTSAAIGRKGMTGAGARRASIALRSSPPTGSTFISCRSVRRIRKRCRWSSRMVAGFGGRVSPDRHSCPKCKTLAPVIRKISCRGARYSPNRAEAGASRTTVT
jgi:hypothetical protein